MSGSDMPSRNVDEALVGLIASSVSAALATVIPMDDALRELARRESAAEVVRFLRELDGSEQCSR